MLCFSRWTGQMAATHGAAALVTIRSPKLSRTLKPGRRLVNKAKPAVQTTCFLLGWDILLTNLQQTDWTLAQIFDLYPIRFAD